MEMEKWEGENNKINLEKNKKHKPVGKETRHIDQDLRKKRKRKKELHFICRAAALIQDERSTFSKIINLSALPSNNSVQPLFQS